MEVYFNELSVRKSNSILEADIWVNTITDVINELSKMDKKLVVQYTKPFFNELVLYNNYTFVQSLNKIDKDKRSLFLAKLSKENLIYPYENYPFYDFEIKDKVTVGLGYAYINKSFSISLVSSDLWMKDSIDILQVCLDDDDTIETRTVTVQNISLKEHIEKNLERIKNRMFTILKEEIYSKSGTDLWNERKQLFPNLIFCSRVEESVTNLKRSNPEYQKIISILISLNSCFDDKNLSVDSYLKYLENNIPSKFTDDSQSSKKNRSCIFLCPDNEYREFYYHFRYTPGAGRIHIHIDFENKICYIGHIGRKIGT